MMAWAGRISATLAASAAAGYSQFSPFRTLAAQCDAASPAATDGGLPDSMQLVQVLLCFRHGARTPLHSLPPPHPEVNWPAEMVGYHPKPHRTIHVTALDGSPKPPSNWDRRQQATFLPGGSAIGQLTVDGRQDCLDLGAKFKARYIDEFKFISEYDPTSVFVRSTNSTRTIESARGVLTGMFGSEGRLINIVTECDHKEGLYPNLKHCHRLREFSKTIRGTIAEHEHASPLLPQIARILGVPPAKLHIVSLRDVLVARQRHGKELPLDEKHVQVLGKISSDLMVDYFTAQGQEGLSLAIGKLLQELKSRIEAAVKEDFDAVRMAFYSGHDTTLFPLLLALNAHDGEWPPFSSYVALELLQDDDGKHFVRLIYNDKPVPIVGSDSEFCPLDKFLAYIGEFIPHDWELQCGVPANEKEQKGPVVNGDGS